jgi:hypothetical protein
LCASRKNQGHGKVGKLKQQLLTSSYSYVVTGAAMLKTAETETAIDNQHLLKIAETAERKMSTGTASDVIAMTVNHTRGHAAGTTGVTVDKKQIVETYIPMRRSKSKQQRG